MARDPELYPDPDVLLPERFLNKNGVDLSRGDPAEFLFGFGRRYVKFGHRKETSQLIRICIPLRICPGRYFAEASFFILVASILHVFDILPPVDQHGAPKKLKHSMMSTGVVS